MMTGGQPALSAAKGADGRTGGVWLVAVALAAAMLLALIPGRAAAQRAAANSDERVLAAYRLSEATLAKYIRAARAMAAIAKLEQPDDAEDAEDEDDEDDDGEDNDPSIAELAAMYDTIPAARRAITAAGLTTREYVIFTLALFQAGMAAWLVESQGWDKLPPDIARANVEFYQRHKAQLDSVTTELKRRSDTEP